LFACRIPDREIPTTSDRADGEGFPFEGYFGIDGKLVPCKLQLTTLQSFLCFNISLMGSRCGAIHDLRQRNGKMKFERSECPITNVLDLLGDKWTLLVIRDLVLGKRRYQEFISSPERIASNILADRLKKLEAAGLVTRRTYQGNPPRYEYLLTKKGKGLEPVLEAIIVWGKKLYPGTKRFPRVEHR
jgi:DNA-binding HxlR family transcriptional regulator